MRRVALIYNPASGQARERRLIDVGAAAAVLRSEGMEVTTVATRAAGSAGEQARAAVLEGCDAIVACGGDGTVHDVLQGMVSTPAALGVLPLGTGNALACDLGMARDPATAARQLARAEPRRVAAGKVEYRDRNTGAPTCRFFTVIAGVGADAQMLYSLDLTYKRRHGMTAYYATAARLFFFHALVPFEIEVAGMREEVYQAMAIRVQHFGGILRRLAPEAGLERNDLSFVLFRTRNRLSYGLYVLRGLLEQRWPVPGTRIVHAPEAVCRPLERVRGRRLYAEADGEVLGSLPVRISIVPSAVTLLTPEK
jgi:diacylglycerol kinase (ATP)